jgi:hypothetical protein
VQLGFRAEFVGRELSDQVHEVSEPQHHVQYINTDPHNAKFHVSGRSGVDMTPKGWSRGSLSFMTVNYKARPQAAR